jgi:hypothetical protein
MSSYPCSIARKALLKLRKSSIIKFMTGEYTPFLSEAIELISEYSTGDGSLMETTVAVNAVRSWDAEKAKPLEVMFLHSIRARAIRTLTEPNVTTPQQSELTSRVITSIDGMESGSRVAQEVDKVDELGFWLPEITESVMAMPDAGFVQYLLTLRGKAPRPQDGDLENIAHPAITLSDKYVGAERKTGLIFTQGTHTHETLEGIILASSRTDSMSYFNTIQVPEEADPRIHSSLDAFLLKVETSPLYCSALGAFSIIQ